MNDFSWALSADRPKREKAIGALRDDGSELPAYAIKVASGIELRDRQLPDVLGDVSLILAV